VHLSYRIASTGRGTGRDDAVDFRKILGREHDVRGAHILLKVLARFRAGYRKRAGGSIWGKEREPPLFSESNNCKEPLYYR
jgi:hypothetical protein